MDRESVHAFISHIAGPNTPTEDHPKWVGLHCLLSRWTHVGGVDQSPSAGISVNDGDKSVYHCFACGKRSLPNLLRELEKYTGESYKDVVGEILHDDEFGVTLPSWGSHAAPIEDVEVLDESLYLSLYENARGHPYLTSRGIGKGVTDYLGLLVDDADSEGEERIIFPVYTPDKGLLGVTGRATNSGARLKVRDYHGLKKAYSLLGCHLRCSTDKFIVVVEGLFDYAKCVQANYYTGAIMHASITDAQVGLLLRIGLPVVSFLDNDETGIEGTRKLYEAVKGYLPFSAVTYPRGARGRQWKELGKKDPGSLSSEEIVELVENAGPADM